MTDNSNTAPELLPCPFCGGKATTWLNEAYSCDSAEYVLGCDKCDIYTPFNTVFGGSKPTVVDVICWNTRADLASAHIREPELKAEITRLRAENERLLEALERADATIKIADALAEGVGLVISTTDPRVYLQAFDGVRVSHDAYRKSRAALAKETSDAYRNHQEREDRS